ncbi:MAG: SDR family oxidoreductase [Opitutales bacterium]|nr:SDR family oxidoreductase [Opitutales bacterium]
MDAAFSLKDKTILVSGATSGIGRECALYFAQAGAKVVAAGRSAEKLDELKAEISGGGHCFIQADLGEVCEIESLANSIPQLDGFIHCAGADMRMPIKFSDRAAERKIFEVNYFSAVEIVRAIVKSRKMARGGAIVFMSSVSANFANAGHFAYGNSKAALSALAREMAVELAPRKIRVNSISAGLVETPMTKAFLESDSPELEADRKKYLLGYGKAADVARLALFLLSDASAWMTGGDITIDGGYSCQK